MLTIPDILYKALLFGLLLFAVIYKTETYETSQIFTVLLQNFIRHILFPSFIDSKGK